LLEATARALYLLIHRAFPDALQAGDVYKLMEMVHAFFMKADPSLELQGRNQDLAGFFTSVLPHEFQDSWTYLYQRYRQFHLIDNKSVITVDLLEKESISRMFHGRRRRRAKSQVQIWMEDIPQIIACALKMQWFNVGGRCFKQVCGSPMGS
jgi:hypothetical protein